LEGSCIHCCMGCRCLDLVPVGSLVEIAASVEEA
jgi:hypothetical protein